MFSFTFFSLPLIFTLHWWPLAFLILSPPLQNFHVVLPTNRCRLRFFISRSQSLSPFFSLSFASPLSLFLCLSLALYSKFVDMTIYLSLILIRQHGYRNNFRLPFSSLLTLLLSLLYKTLVAMRFPAKITSSCIWVAIPVDWVILHWYAFGADGRSLGLSVGACISWCAGYVLASGNCKLSGEEGAKKHDTWKRRALYRSISNLCSNFSSNECD